jgi:GxxExxY protein
LWSTNMAETYEPIPVADEELAHKIIGAAIEVHRILGPGFLEVIYRKALKYELQKMGIGVEEEKDILVPYKDILISGQRMDLFAGGRIILELKCVDEFPPIHLARTISYLKATQLRLGLMINFKVMLLRDGIKRVVH